jgi:DNA-3-methyladenine glycosylase
MVLSRSFYKRPTVEVAKDLIGKRIVRGLNGCKLSGVIVETEAYGHADDPASHAFRGMTKRNSVMFGETGIAYVYFTYGNHHCVNVTARNHAPAGAVLIRSVEPIQGFSEMKRLRELNDYHALTTGPGKLAQAMNITRSLNGVDMTKSDSELTIEDGSPRQIVIATPRIGISRAKDMLWRFIDPSSEFLSRKARLASLQVK